MINNYIILLALKPVNYYSNKLILEYIRNKYINIYNTIINYYGKHKLCYLICKHKYAYFYSISLSINSNKISTIFNKLRYEPIIIRYFILNSNNLKLTGSINKLFNKVYLGKYLLFNYLLKDQVENNHNPKTQKYIIKLIKYARLFALLPYTNKLVII